MYEREYLALLAELKKMLSAQGITYKNLAQKLEVSEVTIKRFFTSQEASLDRVLKICSLCNISFLEIVEAVQKEKEPHFHLPEEVEQYFVDNPHIFRFFITVYEGKWTIKEIKLRYHLTNQVIYKYLRSLEHLGLLELYPQNRFVWKVSGFFAWLPRGPLVTMRLKKEALEFVDFYLSNPDAKEQSLGMRDGMVTQETAELMLQKIRDLSQEFGRLMKQDQRRQNKKNQICITYLLGAHAKQFEPKAILEL